VSYTLASVRGRVRADLDTPASSRLRLRLPGRQRIARVTLDGRPYRRFDANTIDLSGVTGRHVAIAVVR